MIKKVCSECGGELKKIVAFKAKVYIWWEDSTGWITLYQCKKCKDVFEDN